MKDATTVIPRNSLIEANQSGLIAEPLIDITPQAPVPQYKGAGGGGATSAGSCSNHAAAATAQQTSTCQLQPMLLVPSFQLPYAAMTLRSAANPLDEDCEKEGLVVCHQGRIRGERGACCALQRTWHL